MGKGRTWRRRRHLDLSKSDKEIYEICHDDDELLQWAKGNCFNASFCPLKSVIFQDTGRGMMATTTITEGNVIISIPQKLLVNTQSVLKGYIGNIIKQNNITDLLPIHILCTFLMCEKIKGTNSFWEPYISSLPATYTTPSYWKASELLLLPPWIALKAKYQIEDIEECYQGIFKLKSQIINFSTHLKEAFTFMNFLWAWNTVNTRAVYFKQEPDPVLCMKEEDNLSLAPILDFLNHSCHVEVDAGFNLNKNCYEIKTKQFYRKGEQVFISYGPHDNIKLLIEYGFVLKDNPHSAVSFELEDIVLVLFENETYNSQKKRKFILENDVNKNLTASFDGISWNLQICLLVCSVLDKDVHEIKKCLLGESLNEQHAHVYKDRMKQILMRKKNLITIPEYGDGDNYHKKLAYDICKEQMDILDYCIGTVT